MNETEKTLYCKYEEQGYDVIHIGVPDFILLKDSKIEFIEVKATTDLLRESQIRAIALLKKHGFEVKIKRISDLNPSSLIRIYREDSDRLWKERSPGETFAEAFHRFYGELDELRSKIKEARC